MQLGYYKILNELGAGGMGVVYKALDPNGREVAIKMIGKHADIRGTVLVNRPPSKHLALDVDRRMMLVREASLAMRLDHLNIVKVFDYGRYAGLLFIVMEYLPGYSLEKLIPVLLSRGLDVKISLIMQLCDALDYAHDQDFVVISRSVAPNPRARFTQTRSHTSGCEAP